MTQAELERRSEALDIRESELQAYAREIQEREKAVQLKEANLKQYGDMDSFFDLVNKHQGTWPQEKKARGIQLSINWR